VVRDEVVAVDMKPSRPWVLDVMAIAMLFSVVIWLASLVVIYWADEYASPSWNEQSVPAPRTY
jgi:hypothetical protein